MPASNSVAQRNASSVDTETASRITNDEHHGAAGVQTLSYYVQSLRSAMPIASQHLSRLLGTKKQWPTGVGKPHAHKNTCTRVSPTSDRLALTGLHLRGRLAQRHHSGSMLASSPSCGQTNHGPLSQTQVCECSPFWKAGAAVLAPSLVGRYLRRSLQPAAAASAH